MKIVSNSKRYVLIIGTLLIYSIGCQSQVWNPAHAVGTVNGIYSYGPSQTLPQFVELFPAATPNTGLTYQWQYCFTPNGTFNPATGTNNLATYNFSGFLTQSTYFRRKTTSGAQSIYSNVIKLSLVSATWEDMNYVREHDVQTTAITTWTAVDQLAIGPKLQITTYFDGIGRTLEKVSREIATPPTVGGLWGDMVQFAQYDLYGREPVRYLPYSTTTQSGKYKTGFLTEQPLYYTNTYSETSAFSTVTFDNSPLDRIKNVKEPGTSWAAAPGNSATYEVNAATDNVPIFNVSYTQGAAPVFAGMYPANTLYKVTYSDENNKQVIEYITKSGQTILKKVQLDNAPADAYNGWICTYTIFDDLGLMRYQIQPEGIKYLFPNSWSFAGANGTLILNEQCFLYNYDEKGRMIWKKAPGAQPLNMLYDVRDRVVFMQDGNQAALSTPQWTANIYDELDRTLIATLYNTTKTIANLKTDISGAPTSTSITITNPGTVSVTAITHLNPITSASLNSASITTILNYQFYDNYSFNAVKTFNTSNSNTTAYSTSDPNVIPIAKSLRTISLPTGSMTRVLGTTTFLSATRYYDEKANSIQNLEDNIKAGVDITTLQYHFDGKILSSCADHTVPSTGYTNYQILTKYLFDKLGRVTSIEKKFGANAFKTISVYDYDETGRLKIKHLDPSYTAGGNSELESLNYTYNLHNQITGINKDYALKSPGTYNKWGHFFGLYMGYDNRDGTFVSANLTGHVTGLMWNTQGDDAQRRYDYTYDNAGRLTAAAFTEKKHIGDSWTNTQMDFSVNGTTGKIAYDLNGNLINMIQKGVLPGTAAPIMVDNLTYAYSSYSNKLQSVTDNMTTPTVNGQFGDLKDGTNGVTPDYVYDANGNLVIDLNKNAKDLAGVVGANGIKYNFLDKPEQIRIVGKGTIQVVYSASGKKLQRLFTPEPSGATVTTSYINQFIYQEASGGGGAALQFINFEEGRVRVVTATSQSNGLDVLNVDGNVDLPNTKRGAYDYFILDYQQNLRMMVTEETHVAGNTCTMEVARATLEESIFGQVGAGNEVSTTRFAKPSAWTGNTSVSVSRIGSAVGPSIGPNALQKVMAGDKITASVNYYYSGSANGYNPNFLSNVVGSLIQAISTGTAAGSLVKGNAASIGTQLNGVSGFVSAVEPAGATPAGSTMQAFLTILFFDERFNFISAADGGVFQAPVAGSVPASGLALTLPNVKAPKNGYAYVYVSNQSVNYCYFDDFAVTITTGNIIEENHYYAYGLKIATVSSKKLGDSYEGTLKNNYLYNEKELFDDADLNWYDYGFRNYDAQIGRFVQLDPLTFDYPYYSPFQFTGNEPIANVDLDGLEPRNTLGQIITIATESAMEGQATRSIITVNNLLTALDGFNATNSGIQIRKIVNSEVSSNSVRQQQQNARLQNSQLPRMEYVRAQKTDEQRMGDIISSGLEEIRSGVMNQSGVLIFPAEMAPFLGMKFISAAVKGEVQYSDDLVKAAQKLYPNKAGLTELHHITPKYLGGAVNGPLVPLNGSYHQLITNEFRALWPYGKGVPSATELQNIMKQVYSKYPLPPGY